MSSGRTPSPDDLLTAAEIALRDSTVPDGPSDEVVGQTLAALRAAADTAQITPFQRRRLMINLSKVAAALVLGATGAYFVARPHLATANTFAETAAKLRDARTLTYRMSMELPGVQEPARSILFFKGTDLARTEADGGGPITIIDFGRRKMLVLDPKSKTALMMEDKGQKPPGAAADIAAGLAANMRALEKADNTPAGERDIAGVRTRGFRVRLSAQQEMTLWINPATDLPVLVETVARTNGREIRAKLSDFVLDRELDDSLFRVEIPAGYTARTVPAETLSDAEVKTLEEAVVRLLKVYTSKSGGAFPPRLDDFNMFEKYLSKVKAKPGPLPDPELFRVVMVMVRFQLSAREIKNQYTYKPEGAKLGDAERVIFWYKPAGAQTHRAVFGDLHIGDVAADKLPR
jgi:outer membrane lipoprotein-sorting protein